MSVAEKMTELADAVRDLTGTTELLTLDDMIQTVRGIGGSDTTNSLEGHPISIPDCLTRKLHGLTLYGKTAQNGIPTPSAPVELENLGNDGNITVHMDEQTLTVSTPNGLPGIPVESGGNYTDANGQQWICDEIDFARGKYVKRIDTYIPPDNSFAIAENDGYPVGGSKFFRKRIGANNSTKQAWCNKLPCDTSALNKDINGFYMLSGVAYCRIQGVDDLAEFHALMNGAEFTFILTTPIETDLTAEELAAYAKLHTNYPQTIIYNDAGAWMKVAYAADTKLYIDKKFAELAAAIVNNA